MLICVSVNVYGVGANTKIEVGIKQIIHTIIRTFYIIVINLTIDDIFVINL